jgi:CrcB protein
VVQSRHDTGFPWGTFTANVTACLVLGLVLGASAPPAVTALVGTGFRGALSTYSTFGYETVQLLTQPGLAVRHAQRAGLGGGRAGSGRPRPGRRRRALSPRGQRLATRR